MVMKRLEGNQSVKKSSEKKTIQSIDRMDEIISYLAERPKGEKLTVISKDLMLNKSTAFGIISTLETLHYLEQDQETGKYYLGLKLFELGQAAYSRLDLVTTARPHIRRLSERYEETVHMGVLSECEVVYLDKVESPRSIRVSTQIGGRQPVYCTALGKLLIAHQPENIIEDVIAATDFVQYTSTTITDEIAFRSELGKIKKQGYAVDDEESELGLFCVAAPIFNGEKKGIAAISIAGTVARVKDEGGEELIKAVKETAAIISANLGYR